VAFPSDENGFPDASSTDIGSLSPDEDGQRKIKICRRRRFPAEMHLNGGANN
jgi:hypothetical protein